MKKLSFSNAFVMRTRFKMVLFLLANLVAAMTHAQIYTIKVTPQEIDQLLDSKEPIKIPTVEVDGLSESEMDKLKAEDKANEQLGKPPRVAVPIPAHITTEQNGVWTRAHGKKLWLLEVKVKNATQLSPLFSHLNLADDAAIWLFTGNREMAMGPITSKNIPQKLAKVTPDFLPSESITIAYFSDNEEPITIQGFNMGYYQAGNGAGFGASAHCNRDVSDPAADCFKFEQNAVAVLLNDNDHSTAQCTGSLINSNLNSNQNIRPFLLTSEHCFGTTNGLTNTNSMRIRFRWQTGMTIRRLVGWWPFRTEVFEGHITFIGATMRASSPRRADFALLELFDTPVGHQVTYLGWDRLNVPPRNITFLHHPKGDFMKITRDADAPVQTTAANGLHLVDRAWFSTLTQGTADVGVSQDGSSGSAWLNQNHQVCGVHSFSPQSSDEFTVCDASPTLQVGAGKINECFRGDGSSATRLREWLDPVNETATLVGTFKLSAPNFIACKNIDMTVSDPDFRTSNGTAYTYRWTKSANLQLSGSGSQVVVKANAALPSNFTDFIECVIVAPSSCNVNGREVIVGRTRHQFTWAANLSVRNTSTNTESTVNFVPLNRSYTFRASIEGAGSGTTYSWSVSGANGRAHFFAGQDFLDVNFFNRGSLNVSVTARFGSCSVTKNYVIVGGGFAPQRQEPVDLETTLIYPNPATNQDVVVELPRGINLQESVSIQLKDINGKTVRMVESKEHNTLLNIQNIPNGIYMVLIQTGETSITKKLIVQH